jgi:hypothetical protein
LTLGYFDPDRDYQAGSQRVARGRSGRALSSEAAVTASADMARRLANRLLRGAEAAVETLEISLSWRWIGLVVGDVILIGDRSETWRIVSRTIEGMLVRLVAEAEPAADRAVRPSEAGRGLSAPVVPATPTELYLFEAPVDPDGSPAGLLVLATGRAGWRGAEIGWSEGADVRVAGYVREPTASGRLDEPLLSGPMGIWDERNQIALWPAGEAPGFESRTVAQVLAGSNLLWIGSELVQFRDAEIEPSGRVVLRGLLRGRLGTEYAIGDHERGALVVLVWPDRLVRIARQADSIGRAVSVVASGPGEPGGASFVQSVYSGLGHAPLAPAHVRVERLDNGDVRVRWVARHREQFDWDASDRPLQPHICRIAAGGPGRSVAYRSEDDGFLYPRATQIADFGAPLAACSVTVMADGVGPEIARAAAPVLLAS